MTKRKAFSAGVVTTLIAGDGTLLLLALSLAFDPHHQDEIWPFFRYQICALALAGGVVLAMRGTVTRRFAYLRLGTPTAAARAIAPLMVKEGESWRQVGLTFGVLSFAATTAWLVLNEGSASAGPWGVAVLLAVPLALSNAVVEELITLWSLVEGLAKDGARWAPYLSALIFGTVHCFGIPGGLTGGVMAAFIAWILAISIQDTNGLFWAITIHFVLDLVIFTFSLHRVL